MATLILIIIAQLEKRSDAYCYGGYDATAHNGSTLLFAFATIPFDVVTTFLALINIVKF